jgi:hypothetical protein
MQDAADLSSPAAIQYSRLILRLIGFRLSASFHASPEQGTA